MSQHYKQEHIGQHSYDHLEKQFPHGDAETDQTHHRGHYVYGPENGEYDAAYPSDRLDVEVGRRQESYARNTYGDSEAYG